MIINPANNPKTIAVAVGSLTSDLTIPVSHMGKKVRVTAVRLINGADITGADNTHVALKLRNGSTDVATLDTDPDLQGSLTKNVALAFSLVSAESLLAAGTDLKLVYDETEYAGLPEITDVLCVADVADSLDQKTFIVSDDAGTVGFWLDTNSAGTAPAAALACARQVKITLSTGQTAAQVATAIAAAVDAQAKFIAVVVTSTTVRITDASVGARTNGSASTSGFTVSINQNGTDADAAIQLTNAQLCLDFYPL